MLEKQIVHINKNYPNLTTKVSILNNSNIKEKNISLFSKKINLEHREFGNDLTNIALTAFEKSNIISNKSIIKEIELIKANIKNKERSREKSLIKIQKQKTLKISKNNKKDGKIRQIRKMAQEEGDERKTSRYRNRKFDLNKNDLTFINSKTHSTNNSSENYNIINISEFNIENKGLNNTLFHKQEECHKQFINKITEMNIEISKDNIPLIHHLNNNSYTNHISNKYNLQYVEEYQDEIIEYLLSLENKKRINPNYMEEQKDINEKMRIILIDWLIEVHLKFKLLPETLFLTACKYEEIYPPEISSFVYITDNAYKKEDILNYELKILSTLDYDLTYPTPLRFLEILIIKLGLTKDEIFFYKMQYLLELSLSKLVFYNYTYLELVISCCLFLYENNYSMTHRVLVYFDLYNKEEKLRRINNCINEIKLLLEYMRENRNFFKGLKQKFAMDKYGCISKMQFF